MFTNYQAGDVTNDKAEIREFEAIQLSGEDGQKNILSVIAKKSYKLSDNGFCSKMDTSVPLTLAFEFKKEHKGSLISDTDLYCNKPFTDVVVKGHTYAKGSMGESYVIVEVSGQKTSIRLKIFGERLAYKNQQGKILFTDPEPIVSIPLEYEYAYGGVDVIAEESFQLPDKEILKALPEFDWSSISPYRYPRNTCGKGYLVENNPRAFEHFELPNIEDPQTPLTPSNLVSGKTENWIYQPLARSTGWVSPEWFPRIAYFGLLPRFDAKAKLNMLPEHLQRLVNYDILEDKPIMEKINSRAANGASAGLQFPYLKGNESIRLVNIHPRKQDFVLQLPNERPRIWVDGRKGTLKETNPVIHTVIIEPDENRMDIVWRGSAPALRPYHEEELKTMPFKVEWRQT